ncbi:hypothetical protein [Vibrio cyclitrophicus]|uniref:hypothetical protein n=1 Tax=Vibrio cyclitrophicus TaxID=47951 RepID=UPI000C834FD8|nr:hypothetical protein [Vibrio cyclitrophicus]PMF23790.1 hypothetical protein BCV18_18440 [Vibrio cyclitrophicus]
MGNRREGWEDINLEELFSDIDADSITSPMDEYLDSLDAFYTTYIPSSNSSTMKVFNDFNPESIDEKDNKFISAALQASNYDVNALRGEYVVLFSEPVIVSEIQCHNIPMDENEGAIRLISNFVTDKKVTTKRTTTSQDLNSASITTYKVHEIVYGLILPKRCDLKSVKLTSFFSLHLDIKTLEKTEKALQKANSAPKIQIQKVVKKFQDINSIIRDRQDKLEIIQRDINALEQKKSHTENSLENSQDTLKKVSNDINSISKEYENVSTALSRTNQELDKVKKQLSTNKREHDDATNRLYQIKTNITGERETLQDLQEELTIARREKNLTTFDTAGHTAETKTQLVAYYWFAALTFIGLATMAIYVYRNAQDFMDTLPYLIHVSAWDILLSRLPLMTATTLIIGGLSGILFFLIKHIVSLNTEKMTMLKAGILAEQITNSLECKNMTEEEVLEFKRDTKIKLIMQVFSKSEPEVDKNNIIIEALKAMNSK